MNHNMDDLRRINHKLNVSQPFIWLLTGAALGALALLIFDPSQSLRRREWAENEEDSTTGGKMTDETLTHLVRRELGRLVSYPKSVITEVRNGVLTLSGVVNPHEVSEVVAGLQSLPGISKVINHLDVHDEDSVISHHEYLQ